MLTLSNAIELMGLGDMYEAGELKENKSLWKQVKKSSFISLIENFIQNSGF